MLANAELSQYGPVVLRIQNDFDRPLLVAVMGEFNTGKSTFVNALIGEKIAPMGITPTTATINILKYGEEQRARILWRDDREEMLSWDEVGPFLRKLNDAEARKIRVVELLYPSEELQRVNVVDTPGLNSLVPEHEETAREYIEIADAVVWLFAADQAGKQTEEEALTIISKQRLKTVAVLNKVDRLNEEERKDVVAHIEAGFSHLIEGLMPVSSRQALKAIVEEDAEALQNSEFPQLRRFLEERIFSRSRRIKQAAAERRLREVLTEADRGLQGILSQVQYSEGVLAKATEDLDQLGQASLIIDERPQLAAELSETYVSAAKEIVEFVRPRRWILGENEATAADKDYLLDLLQEGIGKHANDSHLRLRQRFMRGQEDILSAIREISTDTRLPELTARVEEVSGSFAHHLHLLEQVYRGYLSFVRGFLHGGWIDQFFNSQLPELQIAVEPIRQALKRKRLDLEGELLSPLTEWQENGVAAQREQLKGLRRELQMKRMDIELRLAQPLLSLITQLGADQIGEVGEAEK
jgi:GTPase Era involved in 16S rRNA processing